MTNPQTLVSRLMANDILLSAKKHTREGGNKCDSSWRCGSRIFCKGGTIKILPTLLSVQSHQREKFGSQNWGSGGGGGTPMDPRLSLNIKVLVEASSSKSVKSARVLINNDGRREGGLLPVLVLSRAINSICDPLNS